MTVSAALLAVVSGLAIPHIDYTALLPELILLGGVLVLIGISATTSRQPPTGVYAAMTAAIAAAALVASLRLWRDVQDHGAFTTVAHSVDVDGFAVYFLVLVPSILVVAAILGSGYLRREGVAGCEYYALALISGSGAMLMASANDLVLIFLALEVLSIPLYVMAGFDRRRQTSQEAAIKYFVLGAFSSAVFVYGIALVYGATGSTNLPEIGAFLAHNVITANGVLLAGIALLLVGFSFKVAAVPFHMWTPDVYQGAPTPVTGFMAALAKAGGFAAFLRVFVATFPTLRGDWQPLIWALAAVTLLGGATVALAQRDVKRMLAYSSINHAGFVLIGLQAATTKGVAAGAYYVFAYAFMVLGSFAVVGVVGGEGRPPSRPGGLPGSRGPQPGAGDCLRGAAARPGGRPVHDGVLRQVLRRGGVRRRAQLRPRRHRHGFGGDRRLLLPAPRAADVLGPARRRGRRGGPVGEGPGRGCRDPRRRPSSTVWSSRHRPPSPSP